MDDANDLYRQAKAAQRRAEASGCPDTAAVLSAIADMLAQEAGVDDALVRLLAARAGR